MTQLPLRLAALLAALVLVTGVSLADDEKDKKADKAEKSTSPAQVAHLRLAGDLDEAPAAHDPLFGGAENFKAKLDRILKAKDDKNVQALLIHFDGLDAGYA